MGFLDGFANALKGLDEVKAAEVFQTLIDRLPVVFAVCCDGRRSVEDTTETLSWQNVRRPLPCRFVQPGGLSR